MNMSMGNIFSKLSSNTATCAERFCNFSGEAIITFQTSLGEEESIISDYRALRRKLDECISTWNDIMPHPVLKLRNIDIVETGKVTKQIHSRTSLRLELDVFLNYLTIMPLFYKGHYFNDTVYLNIGVKHLFITTIRKILFDYPYPYSSRIDTSVEGLNKIFTDNMDNFLYKIPTTFSIEGSSINGFESYLNMILNHPDRFKEAISRHGLSTIEKHMGYKGE